MLRAAILAAILVPRLAYAGCETILATDSTKLSKTGDTMTGTFILTAPFTMTGADSYATFASSVNAQGVWGTFTGNLTGNVTGSCSSVTGNIAAYQLDGSTYTTAIGLKVAKAGDTMTGTLAVTGASSYVTSQSSITTSGGFFGQSFMKDQYSGVYAHPSEGLLIRSQGAQSYLIDTDGGDSDIFLWTKNADTLAGASEVMRLDQSGNLEAQGTITAAALVGDGSGITGLSGALPGKYVLYRQEISSMTVAFFIASRPNNHAVPNDDTLPQQGAEGSFVAAATMTFIVASSTAVLEGVVMGCESANSADFGAACIYKDSGQDPLSGCCSFASYPTNQLQEPLRVSCKHWPNDTNAHVYTLKWGLNAASVGAINGCTTRLYGGALQSGIIVREMYEDNQ